MKPLTILGIVLIVLGVASLAYHGIPYTSRDTIVDIGPVHATAEREKTFDIPPAVGIASLAGGLLLLVFGRGKRG